MKTVQRMTGFLHACMYMYMYMCIYLNSSTQYNFQRKTNNKYCIYYTHCTHTPQSFDSTTSNQSMQSPAEEMKKAFGGRVIKEILKGISIYFNPGEMIGIMGPSGCGKTTFLDLLTARRKTGTFKVCMLNSDSFFTRGNFERV